MPRAIRHAFFTLALVLATALSITAASAGNFLVDANRGLCVDIVKGIMKPGTPIIIWQCHGKAPQQLNLDKSNLFVSATAAPHLCLDAEPKQQLRLVLCNDMHRTWVYNKGSMVSSDNTCWDVAGFKYVKGNKLLAWPCHRKANQRFVFAP